MDDENLYKKASEISEQIIKVMLRDEEEKAADLKEWVDTNPSAREVTARLSDQDLLNQEVKGFIHPQKAEELQLLCQQIRRRRNRRRIIHFSGVAAVLVLCIGITLFIYHRPEPVETNVKETYAPILILGNGKSLDLRIAANELTVQCTNIKNDRQGELRYMTTAISDVSEQEEMSNTLVIPRQCTYRVILSDGTIVHLNAESCLEYPVKFEGEERKVKLQGEAYFEVTRDAKPFIVCIDDVQIKVYGTRFDVNSYHKDRFEVVLVEGKVGVTWQNDEKILHSSELFQLNSTTGEQSVKNVETDKYISWTQGYLRYDDDQLEEMIEDLSRWYGVDFEFATEPIRSIRITASINKDLPLNHVLEMIQATTKITFIKQERRYLISQPL